MKAFHFSLQRLLDAKEALEKAAEIRASETQRRLNACELRLENLKEELRSQGRVAGILPTGHISRHELVTRLMFVTRLEKSVERQAELTGRCKVKHEEARNVLVNAVRERKSLENLREREKKQWVLEGRRADRREMDEIAIGRFVRQEKIA